tara:strand:+ start:23 stop:484 length:462 start_codon:yes stop_codon:yes gene_type:complete
MAISKINFNSRELVTTPAFLVEPASTQTDVAEDALTDIVFGTEIFDQNGDFASNTFTAPVTGRYQLQYNLYALYIDNVPNYIESQITTSNRPYRCTLDPRGFDQDPVYWTFTISALADMDAGDTAKVQLLIHSGGTVQTDIATSSRFSGYLVA